MPHAYCCFYTPCFSLMISENDCRDMWWKMKNPTFAIFCFVYLVKVLLREIQRQKGVTKASSWVNRMKKTLDSIVLMFKRTSNVRIWRQISSPKFANQIGSSFSKFDIND